LVHGTKTGKNVPTQQTVPIGQKISQMFLKHSKWSKIISTLSNLRPSKIYPNWDFWFENKPSCNPAERRDYDCREKHFLSISNYLPLLRPAPVSFAPTLNHFRFFPHQPVFFCSECLPFLLSCSGLPDGIFSIKKSQFLYIFWNAFQCKILVQFTAVG
jgi:hypothetical protein